MGKMKTIKFGIIGAKIFFVLTLIIGCVLFVKNKNNVEYEESTNVTYGIRMLDGTVYNNEDSGTIKSDEIDRITVNVEYYNTDKQIKDKEYKISAYITTYINSTVLNEALGVLSPRQVVKSNEKIISNITNVTYEINYKEKIDEINNYIASQKLEGKVEAGIIELSLVSGEEKGIINISLLDERLAIEEEKDIDNVVKKSNILSILIIAGSILMIAICFGIYILIHKFESLSEFEQEKIKIFKFNKDILVGGTLKEEDINNSIIVNNFSELAKVQNMVGLPIIYNKEETKCSFVIKVGNNKYSYILNEQ